MPIINCYVDDETMLWLEKAADEIGRRTDQLAEAAIEDAVVKYRVDCMRRRTPQDTTTP
jgi:hypothetical protein